MRRLRIGGDALAGLCQQSLPVTALCVAAFTCSAKEAEGPERLAPHAVADGEQRAEVTARRQVALVAAFAQRADLVGRDLLGRRAAHANE